MNVLKGTLLASALFVDVARGVPLSASLRSTTAAPNLIVNGTFDTDATGWETSNATASSVGGRLRVTNTLASTPGAASQHFPVEVGATYTFTGSGYAGTITAQLRLGSSQGASDYGLANNNAATSITFTPTGPTLYVHAYAYSFGGAVGAYAEFDNLSVVKIADAPPAPPTNLLTNGTFDTDTTGWTIVAGTQAATGGRLRLTAGAVAPKSEQTFNTEVGRTYRVTYDAFTGTTATGTRVAIRDSSGATITTDDTEGLGVTWTFVATTTTTTIRLTTPSAPGSGLYVEFDNLSIVAL